MSHYHAVAWLDHREAKIFHFTADDVEKKTIKAHNPHRQVHHRAGTLGSGHDHEDRAFMDAVVAALGDAQAWIVVGPGAARTEFAKHVASHAPKLAGRIVGVEPMDHPSDGELVRFARKYAEAADRMRPQRG